MEYGGYDVCGTTFGHDLSITGANVAYEIEIGDPGTTGQRVLRPASQPDTIGHDLVGVGQHDGPIDVGNNSVEHDLAVNNNTPRLRPVTDTGPTSASTTTPSATTPPASETRRR